MFSLNMHRLKLGKIKRWNSLPNSAFIQIVNESYRKPNKLWVADGRKFYNKLMQEWLDNNDIFIYCRHNEGKSEIAIKTLKSKI